MKGEYRDFEIEVKKEESLGGDKLNYYFVHRKSDGFVLEDGFSYNQKTREVYDEMKETVDNYHKNPKEYEDE